MSIHGDELSGSYYNERWDYSSTVTRPPEGWTWHHSMCVTGHGNDVVHSDYDTKSHHRAIRQAWLDQYELTITEEFGYRWWRWYDENGSVRWAERRPISAPLPKVPGFWPSDE